MGSSCCQSPPTEYHQVSPEHRDGWSQNLCPNRLEGTIPHITCGGESIAPVTTKGFKGFVIMSTQRLLGKCEGKVSPEVNKKRSLLMTDFLCLLGP